MAAATLPALQRLLARAGLESQSDRDLWDRFRRTNDGDAFATLVERHGPMVLGLCRRLLADAPDADDAFQATFLTLARRPALARPEALAAWLYGTARRIALRIRQTRRRYVGLPEGVRDPGGDPLAAVSARELLDRLDAEIARLPDRLRLPLVLCALDGLTVEEAAARLDTTPSAVKGRLERARARLHARLVRRGVTLSAALAVALAVPRDGVSAALIESTARLAAGGDISPGVAALAAGSSRWPMLRVALAAVLVVAAGVGWVAAPRREAPAQPPAKPAPPTDLHGDQLPPGAVGRFGTVQHRRAAWGAAAVRPDGKTFLDVDGSLLVRTYDTGTGRLLRTKQLPGEDVQSVYAISQNARVLLGTLGKREAFFHAWNLDTGRLLGKLEPKEWYFGYSWALAADGMSVAIGTLDGRGGVSFLHLWNVSTGEDRVIGQHRGYVQTVRFSPDGKVIFTLDGLGLHAWDVASGAELWSRKGQFAQHEIDVAPDGKSLLAREGLQSGQWMRLDAKTGEPLAGERWPVRTGQETIAFCPDGRLIICKHPSGIRVWDPSTGAESLRIPEGGGRVAFFPDGKSFLGIVAGGAMLQRWDLTAGKPLWPDTRELGHTGGVGRLAFDPAGRRLATIADDDNVRIWDVTTRKPLHVIPVTEPNIHCLVFTPDGLGLFVGGEKVLRQLDVETGREIRRLPIPMPEQWAGLRSILLTCRPTPDGRDILGLVWGSDDMGMKNLVAAVGWDAETGAVQFVRDAAANGGSVGHSPDGERCVDPKGWIREVRTGQSVRQLLIPPGDDVGTWSRPALAFSHDGRFIAAGMSRVQKEDRLRHTLFDGAQVWEAVTGQPLAHVPAGELGCIAFSPDGRTLATASWDSLCGWDVVTGELLWKHAVGRQPRSQYTFAFTGFIEFSPDGQSIATALPDSTVLLWEVRPAPRRPAALKSPAGRDAAWTALQSPDATKGVGAAWALADAGAEALPLLRERLRPVEPINAEKVRRWIAALGEPDFAQRDAAMTALSALGERIDGPLRSALQTNPTAEKRRRIEQLLAAPLRAPPAETVRFLRAVQALETIGSPEARALLRELAAGDASAAETKAAAAALRRLGH
ncbi:MAG: sigma-70 family RNA polymerase sigma factor [Gemmataceae bacterium]